MTKRNHDEAFVRKSLSTHQSTCKECDPSFCTYSSHILHTSDQNQHLLETGGQFCESLFHIFPAPEFGLQEHGCISGETRDNCRPQCLVLIAKFPGFLARYTNCRRTHAEQFMIHDPILHKALKFAKPNDELVMYMKFQPCHHSSGNARVHPEGYLFKNKMDSRSCTELVLKFYLEILKPLDIKLTIKTASIYKANWEFSKREDDIATTEKALEGVRILLQHNINLQSMTPADWVFLASLSTNVNHLNLFSSARLKTDAGIAKFYEKTKLSI